MSLLGLQARQKGLDLQLCRSATLPQYVRADARKLRQILFNLVGNAVKFAECGRVTLKVADKAAGGGPAGGAERSLEFAIEDTGPGIAPEEDATPAPIASACIENRDDPCH